MLQQCRVNVGAKYFSAYIPTEQGHVPVALCEEHHAALACARCGVIFPPGFTGAISAGGRKYHLAHFTCTVCDTPLEQYFVHGPWILCPFHFSTRYASRCPGCEEAILDKLVEIKGGPAWHGVCYMAHKLWNIRMAFPVDSLPEPRDGSEPVMTPFGSVRDDALQLEQQLTSTELAARQQATELRVYRIWTILSAFEESTSTFVSRIMRDVSNRRFGDVLRVAQAFILHVEVLLSSLQSVNPLDPPQAASQHARNLCRRIVKFFLLLSESQELDAPTRLTEMDLMSMAIELKAMIRTALIAGLVDLHQGQSAGLNAFLDQLSLFAGNESLEPEEGPGQLYGFRSIPRQLKPVAGGEWTDRCKACGSTIEDGCYRLGINTRWHTTCFHCSQCLHPPLESGGTHAAAVFRIDPQSKIFCPDCMPSPSPSMKVGAEQVCLLEQYAFLLRVALSRLLDRFEAKHLVPPLERKAAPPLSPPRALPLSPPRGASPLILPRASPLSPSKGGTLSPPRGAASPHLTTATAVGMLPLVAGAGGSSPVPMPGGASSSLVPPGSGSATPGEEVPLPSGKRVESFHSQRLVASLGENELVAIKHMAVAYLEQSPLKGILELDELLDLIETRKNTFFARWFKAEKKERKEVKKRGLFGVPLELLVERDGVVSTLGAGGDVLIPQFLDSLIHTMRSKDLRVEGIFRKNGNIRQLKEEVEALDKDQPVSLEDDSPIQLAVLLKKFLHELPDPLLTFRLHTLFVRSQAVEPEEERVRLLQAIAMLLPRVHRDVLEVLSLFLRWVSTFASLPPSEPAPSSGTGTPPSGPAAAALAGAGGSKMDLPNLALVMAPNLLYPRLSMADKSEAFAANRAVTTILTYQDAFWHVPSVLAPALRPDVVEGADKVSRELVRRCERLLPRPPGGRGPAASPSLAPQGVRGIASPSLGPQGVRGMASPSLGPHGVRGMASPSLAPATGQVHRPHSPALVPSAPPGPRSPGPRSDGTSMAPSYSHPGKALSSPPLGASVPPRPGTAMGLLPPA